MPIIGRACRHGRGFDARQRAKARQRLAIEVAGALVGISRGEIATLIVSTSWASNPRCAIQRDERANEDTGAKRQDDGHGDLHDDERLSHWGA